MINNNMKAIVGEKVRGTFARLIELFYKRNEAKESMGVQSLLRGRYRHYKGKEYTVLGVAHHSETLEELVVYRAEYNTKDFGSKALWVRPRAMFEEKIVIDGEEKDRFIAIK